MAIKKDTDKVVEEKNGMKITDNMDGEKRSDEKLNTIKSIHQYLESKD